MISLIVQLRIASNIVEFNSKASAWGLVLPQALPGILTDTILAISRAIGETASLIAIGALTFIAFLPPLSIAGLPTPFTALPIQTFN